MKARCTGCSLPAPIPSTVVIVLPATALTGSRQLTTGAPSSSTVQAPQTPAPHTSLVPVSRELIAQDVDQQRFGIVRQGR